MTEEITLAALRLNVGLDDMVEQVIAKHIEPMELKSKPIKYGNMWRALVAVAPFGPLILMEFKIVV